LGKRAILFVSQQVCRTIIEQIPSPSRAVREAAKVRSLTEPGIQISLLPLFTSPTVTRTGKAYSERLYRQSVD
jgi:hypothetical protein